MSRLLIGAAVAFTLVSATAAFAATPELSKSDASQLCTKLDTQFSALTPFKEGLPYWQKASMEHKAGDVACKSGKSIVGAQDLQASISDMYVKPDTL